MLRPELIVVNANIVTMDPLTPRAEALAVVGGRVAALGSTAEIAAFGEATTRIVDAGGRLVLPGFQDTHIHLQDSGYHYGMTAALDDARTPEDLQQILRDFAAGNGGSWVNGVGWYTGIFTEHNLDRHVLDAVVPDRPCFILASDGHNACINTRACEAVGLVRGTADPHNGHFVLDADGVPTGMLHEDAVKWVEDRMPEVSDADYADGVRYGQALCNRNGITGVLDALVEERHARVYKGLAERGELTVRICATAKVFPHEETASALARVDELRCNNAHEMFRIHSAKFFLDGVIENRTAVMLDDYSDAIGGNAPLMFGHAQVKELFTAFDAARYQIHVHVIGDGAVRAALDGLEAARDRNGLWPSLHQLAHIQCIDPSDIPRFRELGAVANVQALWARHEPSVTDVALPMVGEARGKWMYAFRSLIDAGADWTLSSDWGVSTLNPFQIMETALTRQPPRKEGDHPVFLPEQRLTREECIKGYTVNAARTAWREASTGSLSVGKYADIIILDRDILTCDPYDIGDTEVLLTLLGGREVHRAEGFAG
ncbi:amidohydrolase [Rhizobiaceae bacterium n13]|uniref:Amidohydrolase n=1 Tax=Ferirhizobium litorale TaxID=2927786 RepID=A0AAE3QCG2_9HYPH|nr:amidohydrolase [Fererhizobium litorale]MDI7863130.1 amidohydrolase [Fererhizobium litorale]MDI7923192.1 amidohydrolase [Fererhizobium litorale]